MIDNGTNLSFLAGIRNLFQCTNAFDKVLFNRKLGVMMQREKDFGMRLMREE